MADEIDLVTLSLEEWQSMLEAAAELDLVRGGYFRARPSSILFFCDADNAPMGWEGAYGEGTPEAPRALVGEAEVHASAGKDVEVRLVVSNWGAMKSVKQAYDRGAYRGRWTEFLVDQESAFRGRNEDREWLRRRFERLRAHGRGGLVEE
jgi:hypothetical protein